MQKNSMLQVLTFHYPRLSITFGFRTVGFGIQMPDPELVEALKTSNLRSTVIMANLIRFLRQPAPSHLLLHGVILA
jgi:hypothetical protein